MYTIKRDILNIHISLSGYFPGITGKGFLMKRVVIAGAGVRALGWAKGIIDRCQGHSELVALYDINGKRMEGFCALINKQIPSYTDFEKMLRETKPTVLLICTPDYTHPDLVDMGFAAGLDIVTEKPMGMSRDAIHRILAAEKKYNKKITVGFNYRFIPYPTAVRQVMMEKPVGEIKHVSAQYYLDYVHAREYFHRWHAQLKYSGGLLVHKATHHFDILNWYIDDEPTEVFAFGSLQKYGAKGPYRGERCSTCPHAGECPEVLKETLEDADLNPGSDGDIFKKLYFDAEHEDGYFRDQCVFGNHVDIYDSMNVLVKYRNGAQMSYALNAFAPWQGYRYTFTGTKGVVEVSCIDTAPSFMADGTPAPEDFKKRNTIQIVTGTNRKDITLNEIQIDKVDAPHGGGDYAMFEQIFGAGGADPLGRIAGSRAGAASAMIGIGADESIISGMPVKLEY